MKLCGSWETIWWFLSHKYTDETRRTRSWIKNKFSGLSLSLLPSFHFQCLSAEWQLGHVIWPKLFVWDSGFHKMTEGITSFIMFEKKGLPSGQIRTCVSSGFFSQFSMHNLIKFNPRLYYGTSTQRIWQIAR
jgi:hypothetical protein